MDIPQPPPYLRRDWQCQSRWLVLGTMVEFSTERTHNANVPNGTLRQQRGTDKKNWIMSKKRNTTIVIDHLIDKVEINSAAKMSRGALKNLRTVLAQEITDEMVEACIKALGDFATRQQGKLNGRVHGGHCSKDRTRPQQSVRGNGKCKGVLSHERVQMYTNNRLPHTPVGRTKFWLLVLNGSSVSIPNREPHRHGQFRREELY